jgi:hypothetical protein
VLLVPRPTPKLEYHPLLFVLRRLFNIFATTLHSWRPALHPQLENATFCGDRDLPNTDLYLNSSWNKESIEFPPPPKKLCLIVIWKYRPIEDINSIEFILRGIKVLLNVWQNVSICQEAPTVGTADAISQNEHFPLLEKKESADSRK